MSILSIVLSVASLIGYAVTIWSFIHQRSKEIERKSENDAIMRSDIKYLREKMDEVNTTLKEVRTDNGHHEAVISQHEIRIKALEDWRYNLEKQASYKRGE